MRLVLFVHLNIYNLSNFFCNFFAIFLHLTMREKGCEDLAKIIIC